jgi:ubiquinone/menaquinone biosynthesis C-methylase UbiE
MEDRFHEQWESNAQAFAELIGNQGTPHHQEILNPCIERLLGNVKGKKLLDAGCGEGYLSRYYAQLGANVTGVDISEELIKISRKITEEARIDVSFRVGNVCNLDIQDNSFDLILCNLVLLNIPCFQKALSEFCRILKLGGVLVLSIVHPAFNFYGPGSWEMGEKDPSTKRRKGLYFKVDNYFEEKEYQRYWRTRQGGKFPEPMSFIHRKISTYYNSLISSGFIVTDLEEPLPITEDPFFDRERRIPFFLVIKAIKSDLESY